MEKRSFGKKKIRNILFVRTFQKLHNVGIAPPLGLLYLASFLRRTFGNDLVLKVVDMKIEGYTPHDMVGIFESFQPDIIACSVCTDEDACMREVARLAKIYAPGCFVVVGGPHASMYYNEILECRDIDCAIIGEGERTFSDLVRALGNDDDFNTIRGIAVLKDTTVVRTPVQPFIDDLDEIPFPAWDLIDIDRYSHCGVLLMNTMLAGRRYMGVFTSRGCPYQCVFCHNIFGKSWRKRSAENVFAEIKVLHDTYGVDEIHFFDDIFNLDRERVKKICDLIIQDGMHVRLAFPNALRADILDRETVLKLKEAGAYAITFALETSSVRLQKMLHKNIDLDVLSEMIVYSSKIGLLTKCYTMLGFPTETEEEMTGTIDFVCNLPLEAASFFVVTPQKGTPMYAMIQCMFPDFSVNFNQYNYYMPNNRYEKLLGLPISQFQRKAYRKFFFNIPRLLRLWRKTPRKEYLFRCLGPFCSRVVSILSREK